MAPVDAVKDPHCGQLCSSKSSGLTSWIAKSPQFGGSPCTLWVCILCGKSVCLCQNVWHKLVPEMEVALQTQGGGFTGCGVSHQVYGSFLGSNVLTYCPIWGWCKRDQTSVTALLLCNTLEKFLLCLEISNFARGSQECKGQTTKLFRCSTLGIFELMAVWCLVFWVVGVLCVVVFGRFLLCFGFLIYSSF